MLARLPEGIYHNYHPIAPIPYVVGTKPNGNFRDPARNRLGLYTDMPLKYRNRGLICHIFISIYIYICMTYVYIYIYHKPRIEDLPQFFGKVLGQPLAAGWCSAASPWICSRAWRCIWEMADVCVCVFLNACTYILNCVPNRYTMLHVYLICMHVCNVM